MFFKIEMVLVITGCGKKKRNVSVLVWCGGVDVCSRLLVICGPLLVVCGCLLVVCGRLLVVCGRLLIVYGHYAGGLWSFAGGLWSFSGILWLFAGGLWSFAYVLCFFCWWFVVVCSRLWSLPVLVITFTNILSQFWKGNKYSTLNL